MGLKVEIRLGGDEGGVLPPSVGGFPHSGAVTVGGRTLVSEPELAFVVHAPGPQSVLSPQRAKVSILHTIVALQW